MGLGFRVCSAVISSHLICWIGNCRKGTHDQKKGGKGYQLGCQGARPTAHPWVRPACHDPPRAMWRREIVAGIARCHGAVAGAASMTSHPSTPLRVWLPALLRTSPTTRAAWLQECRKCRPHLKKSVHSCYFEQAARSPLHLGGYLTLIL